jgi:hypothetical protein
VRSSNAGSRARLRKSAAALLREPGNVEWLVLEGVGDLADVWRKEAERMGVGVHIITAERILSRFRRPLFDLEASEAAVAAATWSRKFYR